MDNNGDSYSKGRDFLQIFNKVAEFTKELLQQNEALKSADKERKAENEALKSELGEIKSVIGMSTDLSPTGGTGQAGNDND